MGHLSDLRHATAHVFVDDLESPDLADGDLHHLGRVLRLRPGEVVTLSDGRGSWRRATWTGRGVDAQGEVANAPAPAVIVTLGLAVPKGDRAEMAVQKLTELGADRIIPLKAERSVVRWGDRTSRHLERWRAISREAAMQSRRVRLPEICAPMTVLEALDSCRPSALAEPGGAPPSLAVPTLFVGPEGGWSPDELAAAKAVVGLGQSILRTETAAITAAALLNALRGGNVREA